MRIKLVFKTFFLFSLFFIFIFSPLFVFAFSLGEKITFNIEEKNDIQQRKQISAEAFYQSENAEFFVADDYLGTLDIFSRQIFSNNLIKLASEFDNVIYPKETGFFGSEWNPGIDNNSRIAILLTQMINLTGGYMRTQDEFLKTEVPESNERELIYLNVLNVGKNQDKSFLSHEFQHLISFNQLEKRLNKNDDVWSNELRSEYAPTFLGYNASLETSFLKQRLEDFKKNPTDSITEWKNELTDYGSVSLFGHYLADRYGEGIIPELLKANSVGIEGVEEIFKSKNIIGDFADLFFDWEIANYLNDASINEKWGYKNLFLSKKFNIPASTVINQYPYSSVFSLKDWQPQWIKFEKGWPPTASNLKLEFERPDFASSFKIAYLTFEENGTVVFNKFEMNGKTESVFVKDFGGKIKSILVLPLSQKKKTKFSENESIWDLTIRADFLKTTQPVIDSITPEKGPAKGRTLVSVSGENFTSNMKIYLFSQKTKRYKQIKKFNFIDSKEIRFKMPRRSAGIYDIVFVASSGDIITKTSGFTYLKK